MRLETLSGQPITIDRNIDSWTINGKEIKGEIVKKTDSEIVLKSANKLHCISIEGMNKNEIIVSINGKISKIVRPDEHAELLKKIGITPNQTSKASSLKAPMPGTVLKILVEEGASVREGDKIIILEAMKMENVIKCQNDNMIKTIHVEEKQNVDKNQVLVTFE